MVRNIGMVLTRLENLSKIDRYKLTHTELILFDEQDRETLEEFVWTRGLSFGIHSPLFRPAVTGHPLSLCLLDFDEDRRRLAVKLALNSIHLADDLGAEYVTIHLQRPVGITGDSLNSERADEALRVLCRSTEEILEAAQRYAVEVVGENMVSHPLFYSPEHYARFFERFPSLGFCFDLGHAAIDGAAFGFSWDEFLAAVTPYIHSVHLYNNRVVPGFDFARIKEQGVLRKHPPHPSQKPEDGWMPVESILRHLLRHSPIEHLNFEIYASMDTDPAFTQAGMDWVKGIVRESYEAASAAP